MAQPRRAQVDAARLRHVLWIGGGSGAGKSTIANRLAAECGLRPYSSDDAMADHVRRSNPSDHPLLHRFLAMSMDERWLDRSPAEMLRRFHGFRGEGFELIVEDLLALPAEPRILAEGFRLLPRLVAPLLSRSDQAAWLIPTPEFRRAVFAARGSAHPIARKTSRPEQALQNLLSRDALFTTDLADEAAALGLPLINVDVGHTIDDTKLRVAQVLNLATG